MSWAGWDTGDTGKTSPRQDKHSTLSGHDFPKYLHQCERMPRSQQPAQGKSALDGMWKASPTRGHSFYGETLDPQFMKALCKARHNQALPGVLLGGQSTMVLSLLLASVPGTPLTRLPRPLSNEW